MTISERTSRPAVLIRSATAADRLFVLDLAARLAAFELPPWRSADEIADGDRPALNKAIDEPDAGTELFVAELDNRPAGCLLMWTLHDYFTGKPHAHIAVLAVTREAEGRGVGRALMMHAEQWATARGHASITLGVFEGNRRAQALYERMGYQSEIRRYTKQL